MEPAPELATVTAPDFAWATRSSSVSMPLLAPTVTTPGASMIWPSRSKSSGSTFALCVVFSIAISTGANPMT